MPLTPGTRLGPYEIESELGKGGMGEVYRARDSRLHRGVALKVLTGTVAYDPQFRERFDREARAISALNHPNICTLFDIGHQDGIEFLVMELLDGSTLAARISRGPIPHAEVVSIATQIGSALDAAHRAGIVHRDLKPGNIMITKGAGGSVQTKLLDFGLARPVSRIDGTETTQAALTAHGDLLGTLPYMAPEQLEGRHVDARTDIWAFGCVLYEMVSGRRTFTASSDARLISEILTTDPQPLTSRPLDRVIRKCLAKDPDRRWQTAADLTDELLWIGDRREPMTSPRSTSARLLPWLCAAVMGVALVAVLLTSSSSPSTQNWPARRLLAHIGAEASMTRMDFGPQAILSPDGTTLAFIARQSGPSRLFVRKLDRLSATPLDGTEGADSAFFSPDGRSIAFVVGNRLRRVATTGGPVFDVCRLDGDSRGTRTRGGTWTDDGRIVFSPFSPFSPGEPLMQVSADGGTPSVWGTLSERARTQRWPQALPGGAGILYTEHPQGNANFDDDNLVIAPISGGPGKVVFRGGYFGRYLPPSPTDLQRDAGHLIYVKGGRLFAMSFDLRRLEPTGPAVPVIEDIVSNSGTGGAQLDVSHEGTVLYLEGETISAIHPVDWLTSAGTVSALRAKKANWRSPRFSPDGEKLALEIFDGKQWDIWVYDLRSGLETQLTFGGGNNQAPVWTPDGRRIVFSSDRAAPGVLNLYWVNADNPAVTGRLTDGPDSQVAGSWWWSSDNKYLAFQQRGDIMILPVQDGAAGLKAEAAVPFLRTPAGESDPTFSRDGKWIAYTSERSDVWVRPFRGSGGPWRISDDGGGQQPRWSRVADELVFLAGTRVMVASYAVVGDAFRADKPRLWSPSQTRSRAGLTGSFYDLHPDGKRLATRAATDAEIIRDQVMFVLNFSEYLRTIAPAGR